MPSKSKTKGNAWENALCKTLSETFGGSFTRVPNSGAFTGGKNAKRRQGLSDTQNKIYKGDLIPPDHMPRLVIEAKSYADFRFHQLLQNEGCPQLDEWIGQSNEACDPGDLSLVCFKINRKGSFVFCSTVVADACSMLGNHATYHGPKGFGIVTDLDRFLRVNRQVLLTLSA